MSAYLAVLAVTDGVTRGDGIENSYCLLWTSCCVPPSCSLTATAACCCSSESVAGSSCSVGVLADVGGVPGMGVPPIGVPPPMGVHGRRSASAMRSSAEKRFTGPVICHHKNGINTLEERRGEETNNILYSVNSVRNILQNSNIRG